MDTLCMENAMLTTRVSGETIEWNTGQMTSTIVIFASGTYRAFITDVNGNVTVDEREITLITVPNPVLPVPVDPGPFCLGDSITYEVSLTGYDSIQWNNGLGVVYPSSNADGSQVTIAFVPGAFITYVAFYRKCNESLTVLPPLRLSEDDVGTEFSGELDQSIFEEVCPGDTLAFNFSGEGVASLIWEDGSTLPERTVEAAPSSDYSLEVNTQCGDTLFFPIEINYRSDCEACEVVLPELISPNGDGINDRFGAFTNCSFTRYDLKVFNRWGQVVFSSPTEERSWDGTVNGQPQNPDLYLYQLNYQIEGNAPQQQSGSFSLVR